MEPPSGPARRRHVPWNRLLLAVSLLTFGTPPTTAQLTIEVVPPLAAEGTDVLLLAHNVTENSLGYSWYRGERVELSQLIASYRADTNVATNGSVHSGRETLYPNGTLLIQHVTQKDTGSYTLLILKNDLQTERQTGHLHVHHPVARPSLQASNTTVTEHEGPVVLTCLTDETGVSIRWFFKGQSLLLTRGMTLSLDNSTLTIDPVSRKDAGDYQCEVSNRANSRKSDPHRLSVTWQENTQALNVETIVGIVIGLLLVLTLVAALGCFIFLHRGNWLPASTSGRGPSGSSVSQASLPDARSPVPIYQELLRPDTDVYCQINHKADRAAELLHSRAPPQGCPPPSPFAAPTAQQPLTLSNLLRPRSSPLSQFPTLDSVSSSSQPGPPEGQTPLRRPSAQREGQQSSHSDCRTCERFWTGSSPHRERGQQRAGPMEPPSGPASRRHVPWNRLLLAVSLLTFWPLPTTARLSVDTVLPLAAEGTDVLLLAHNMTENSLGYAWYRGERVENIQLIASYRVDTNVTTKGSAHSGRETLYPNGTLLIQTVTQKDTGSYTLLVTNDNLQTERQTGHLCIYHECFLSDLGRCYPHPSSPATTPAPGSTRTLVLTCRFETQDIFYMYSINNQSLHNSTRLELCKRNRTLTVFNVTRNDTGPYVCEARNPENIIHGDPINLNGLCQENSPALNNEIVIAIMTGILVRLALVTTLGCFVFLKMTRRASGQNDLREQQPPAATLGHGPSGSSVSPASLPSPRPIVPLYEELLYPNTDIYCQIHPKVDVVS
ncbi:unnamed protein product [Rangifer tarandus platyrhynchus]|uniref:Uncharacterized protein n=1 Tax=Rangifer tarandus platyrhynchus TaxID=3082113 RepID=A0AC59YUC1_RANTA